MAKSQLNLDLVKQAIIHQMANQRQATAATKTRGQVSGGGRKPWKQKGTGRARAGSSRSPIWVGGGVTFGPNSAEQYRTKLPRTMAKAALRQLLDYMLSQQQIKPVSTLKLTEAKTKRVIELLNQEKLPTAGLLLVTEKLEPELILATNNLPGISVMTGSTISILDLAKHQMVVMEQPVFDHYFPKVKFAVVKKPNGKTATQKKTAAK